MAGRTVRVGFIVYTDGAGRPVTGWLGDEVDVHEDDLERFDRLNPAEPEAESDESTDDELDEGVYKGVLVKDLKVEIEKRNADREDGNKVVPVEPGNRAEIVAALLADDTK